jgi:hypothetical protein
MDNQTGTSLLGWLTAAAAGVGGLITAAVRGERLRNRVDSQGTMLDAHDRQLSTIRKDLHGIREDVHVMRALSEQAETEKGK